MRCSFLKLAKQGDNTIIPNKDDDLKEAAGFAAGGALAGAGISATVGGMGLAVGGTAVAIGAAPVVAAGAVVGLAAYGLKKLLD
ncbi:MAG: hypothetical protein QNJ63_14060 [Calothrix sp. MO_192.B10]|nr:hypothetical protein [Calothrix sp. MO_192.B10]MDJ0734719.1 hypothetical protein [Nostocaceae cyanobacterium]